MPLLDIVLESFHRSPISAVAALVPLAQQMAQKSSPLISAQEKTQSDVQSQENPGFNF